MDASAGSLVTAEKSAMQKSMVTIAILFGGESTCMFAPVDVPHSPERCPQHDKGGITILL